MSELMQLFPGQPVLSLITLFIVLVAILYFARSSAHRLILSLSRAMHNGLRIAARSVLQTEKRLIARNREVLLAQGREASEHIIEREFERVDSTLRRDMAEYPALQRQLSEAITRIDEDYQHSTEVPPSPPGWTKAVAAVAKIPSSDDPMVVEILRGINDSLVKAHENAINEYRTQCSERHQLLKTMLPYWRKLQQVLGQVDKRVNRLLDRSRTIDRHIEHYEDIVKGSDKAVRTLSSSSMTQFFIAAFVLAVAIGGAVINFNLIARPMQEMVGGSSYLMGYKTANIAALVIILVEVAMGLFLMESLRITRLFPTIGALDDKLRVRMMWASFTMLLILAGVEAGLAYMRELLSQDDAALVAGLLNNSEVVRQNSSRWITTAAQMGMGFILPFALTFVAIPLESFVESSRTVLGALGVALLRSLAMLLRLLGNIAHYFGTALAHVYDLLIFAPLWLEGVMRNRKTAPVREAKPKVLKHQEEPAQKEADVDVDIHTSAVGAGS
jgi:hypothetical protein